VATIEELLSQIGALDYKPPSSYKGYQSRDTSSIGYTPVNLPKWNLTAQSFASPSTSKKPSGWKPDLMGLLTGTLGQLGGSATDSAYHALKNVLDKDTPLWKKALALSPNQILGEALVRTAKNGGKEQMKDWKNGLFNQWGDIPPIGFIHGMDKGYKRGSDIMKDIAKVDNRWGQIGGGLAIDILADPLTYATGGLSMAGKLGKVAEAKKIKELSTAVGVTKKFKTSDKFIDSAIDTLRVKHSQKAEEIANTTKQQYAKYPHLADKMAQKARVNYTNLSDKLIAKKIEDMQNTIQTARNTVINANKNKWGVSVPFSKKLTAPLGDIGSKNPLFRSEATLGSEFSHVADNILNDAALGDGALKEVLTTVAKIRYGVNSIEELSKTHIDDLVSKVQPILEQAAKGGIPDVVATQKIVKEIMPTEVFNDLMTKFKKDNIPWKDVQKQLDEILAQVGNNPALRAGIGKQLAEMVSDFWKNKSPKNFSGPANAKKAESMEWASRLLGDSDEITKVEHTVTDIFPRGNPEAMATKDARVISKTVNDMLDKPFNELTTGTTNFEKWLGKKNPFDARTLKTDNNYINSMADHIADAGSQRIGETAKYKQALSGIQQFVKSKNVNPQTMKDAIYILENHFPEGHGGPSALAEELANKLRPVIKAIGDDETSSGVLSSLRKNYFPHVTNMSDEVRKSMEEFAKRHPDLKAFNNLKSSNSFNKARSSFQTLAERDNYIAKLEKAIQKETDPATIETLRNQLDHVADIFDTNVVSALTRRIREGIRSKAMKEMQGELSKYGMMKSNPTDPITQAKGLTKVDSAVAKKLGLSEGDHYVHPEVLEGMKRIDDIFTDQGMKKMVRHVSAISDIWRPLVTYYKPSHYINNIIGNTINNMAAGIHVSDYKAAGKLMMAYRSGKITNQQMKLMDAAFKHNVINGGFLFDSKPNFQFDSPSSLEKFAKMVGDNKVIKKVRSGGEKIDDFYRLANFINGTKKYGSVKHGAKQVREYLFNYNELTNADRHMRVLVPFWNWTKRNVPLQMKLLMENPKFAMNTMRFQQLWNEGNDGEDWQKEGSLKVPNSNHYTTYPNPVSDLNTLINPTSLISSTAPAIKVPIEMMTNRKLFTGQPISYGSDKVKPEDLPEYFASQTGIGKNIYDMLSGNKGVGESLINLFRPVSEIRE
jgi:hypothetical protein